jgi:glycogen synthase
MSSAARGAPLRILMVSSLWPPCVLGGAETYAADLAAHLQEAGHTVGVVTLGVDGPEVVGQVAPHPYRLDEFAAQPRVRRAHFHLLDLYRPSTGRTLTAAFRSFQPDVVHSHSVQGLSSKALAVPRAAGIAHVHTIHDYWLLCQRASLVRRDQTACATRCRSCRAVSALRNQVIRRSPPDVVLAVSRAVLAEHHDIRWLRDRARVVPNPVDPVRPPRHGPRQPPTFGYLGQLTSVKGVRTLLAAFQDAALPRGARLVVAGDGPLRRHVEAAPGAAVEYRGWLDGPGKEAFFADVDCLVVPSEWRDPAPLVVNEARAHGVPVIGAAIGGIPELASLGSRALLFPPGSAVALAERLEAFAARPGEYTADDGTGLVSWAEHLDRVVGAYRDALAANPADALEPR